MQCIGLLTFDKPNHASMMLSDLYVLSVMAGSKRASDDGQDVETDDNGHIVKRPRQESDVKSEVKILLPSRVGYCYSMLVIAEKKQKELVSEKSVLKH